MSVAPPSREAIRQVRILLFGSEHEKRLLWKQRTTPQAKAELDRALKAWSSLILRGYTL
jgi:hypothetical protein